jgi:DMSO/TMAO reductase YedYZ molybdopterin-dependent catalytic subunit
LKALPRQKVVSTIECSGNNGVPVLISAIGNAEWTGTPLAGLLRSVEIARGAIEVVFYGADQGERLFAKARPVSSNISATSRAVCRSTRR